MKKFISYEFNSLALKAKLSTTILAAAILLLFSDADLPSESSSMSSTLTINKLVNNSTPLTGEIFLYTLQYSCISTNDNCEGVVITDPLPPEVEFISLAGSPQTVNETYDPISHTVTFTFQDTLLAGSTGDVQIEVRFPNGVTPDGTVATNTAIIDAANAPAVTSGSVTSTAIASSKPDFEKYYGAGGAAGGTISYELEVCNTEASLVQNGTLNFENISIIDTLPANTTFLGAINQNGTTFVYDNVNHIITFNLAAPLGPGECIYPKVTVSVPSPPWNVGDDITNNATVYYTPVGENPDSLVITETTTLVAPHASAITSKGVSATSFFPGNSGTYSIGLEISGTEDLEDYCVVDTIPAGLVIQEIYHGGYFFGGQGGATDIVTISYETNLGGPFVIAGSPFSMFENGRIDVYDDLGLPMDNSEYITVINWCYGDVYSGFETYRNIRLGFLIPQSVPAGDITNCTFQSSTTPATSFINNCITFEVMPSSAGFRPSLRKYILDDLGSWEESHSSSLGIGDTATFRLRLRNSSSSIDNLIDPIAADFLPAGLDYVAGSWGFNAGGSGAPSPIFSEQPNFNNSGRSLLKWEWTGASSFSLLPGNNVFITFDAIVNNLVPSGIGTLVNDFTLLNNTSNTCSGGSKETDVDDLDSDGDTTEEFCLRDILLNINPSVSFESEKLVKGQLDSVFTKFPDVAHSVPGGIADYILEVRNLGNVPIDSVVIIDIFPSSGDIGVVDSNSRDSRWQPNLVSTVNAPTGVTVYYSIEENPCRADEGFVASGPAGCAAPNWSTTPPSDLTTVRAVKFEFGSTALWPNDTLKLAWAMRVPVNIFSTLGPQPDSIAWNSFGFIGRRTDNDQYTLPSEPLKVGIDVDNEIPNIYGDFVWEDINHDGIQDTGEPGINGVRVELYKDDGDGISNPAVDTLVNFTLTANGGFYLFPNLADGDYYSVFYKPPAMNITTNDAGNDDEIDSDGLPRTYNGFDIAVSPIVTLNNFAINLSWDLGLYDASTGAVGDYIWNDVNANGIQDESSADGLNGIIVNIFDNANPGVVVGSRTTSNDVNGNPGYYLFDNLPPGNYYLELVLPPGGAHTLFKTSGSTDVNDSDFNLANSRTAPFNITAGMYSSQIDGGLLIDCNAIGDNDNDGIGDICDLDDDNDGIPDTEECVSLTIGRSLGFNVEDNYTGTPPGPGVPVTYTTAVDGITRYKDGSLNATELNFLGWDRPGNTSVDWTEGQYIAYSNEDSHIDYPAMISPSPQGGGFGIFSTDNEAISQDIPVEIGRVYTIKLWLGILPTYFENNKDTDGSPGIDPDAGTVSNYGGRIRIGAVAGAAVAPGYTSMGDQIDLAGNPSTVVPYYEYDVTTDFPTTYTLADFPSSLPANEPSGVYTNYPTLDPHWFIHRIEFEATSTTATIQLQAKNGWDVFTVDEFRLIDEVQGCDVDGDGIDNRFDLDSDNDGIYDLLEAGHNAADTNNDGILDGSNADFGTNGLLDILETSADSDEINYAISDSETSSDNIYDAYESDADGDGCFDTEEESISDADDDGIAGTGNPTVDANGMVNSITYQAPINNNWQNANIGSCLDEICGNGIDDDGDGLTDCYDPDCSLFDTDGDAICNEVDIDDDNDGILDLEESLCGNFLVGLLGWTHNNGSNRREPQIFNPSIVTSGGDEVIGSGIIVNDVSSNVEISGIEESNLNEAIIANDYLEYSFNLDPASNSVYINKIFYTKNDFATSNDYGYTISVLYSTDGFISSESVLRDYEIDNFTNGSQQDIRVDADSKYTFLDPNQVHTLRIYFYNKTTPGIARFDDFALESANCDISLDVDNDGIPNHLDLDSDNDGIYDAYEAGHGEIIDGSGRISGAEVNSGINGFFDALETSPDSDVSNYSIADSESSPDGIYDAYDLDADGDTCFDAEEESISDADNDGIAGNGTPTVDTNGLVNSITYQAPANNNWQNASVAACLVEICGNGIDDDGDGITDCPFISGTVFEDINYGGGDGRNYAISNTSAQSSGWASNAINVPNARVELYDSAGGFLASTITNSIGVYEFEVPQGNYFVRVVNRTVSSNRPINGSGASALGIQTFRSIGSTEYINEVGGAVPNLVDANSNTSSNNLSSLSTATVTPQSVSQITVNTADIADINFGFNFSTIVNTNPNGQGSLPQMIINTNKLQNVNLDQEDSPNGAPTLAKKVDWDHSIFSIPGIGRHTISLSTDLTNITDDFFHLTGYTQLGSTQGDNANRDLQIEIIGNTIGFDGVRVSEDNIEISGLVINTFRKGIFSRDPASTNVHIWGNIIGLNGDGSIPSLGGSFGIQINDSDGAFIGTNGDGINDENEGNIISNFQNGIYTQNSENVNISGNWIGLTSTGTIPAGNSRHGIEIDLSTGINVIGYDDRLIQTNASIFRNVISGNASSGIRIDRSNNARIAGNYIGTDINATSAISNLEGITLIDGSSDAIIGTDSDGIRDLEERNIISGNGVGANGGGINIDFTGANLRTKVSGNYIGTDYTGNAPLGNAQP
jgi:uncharacterized repeat protein (TIGR01451 family)